LKSIDVISRSFPTFTTEEDPSKPVDVSRNQAHFGKGDESMAGYPSLIEINLLRKEYSGRGDPVLALEHVSMTVGEGEFTSIVGPSGCGKSTLLKIVAGLIPRTSGEVRIRDELAEGPRQDIGFVFQNPVLLPWRTVLENVLIPIIVLRRNHKDYIETALDLLTLVGLEGFENRYPDELSGGMQQRVALTRALIHDPAILLMDEPFGALDAMTREQMNLELLRIWTERQKTVLFVTHSIPEAVFLSDKVIVLSQRPGSVLETVEVELPRPRGLDIINTESFGKINRHIRRLINPDIRGAFH
jgi:NitT/TauT family transport system ATP-binding protein